MVIAFKSMLAAALSLSAPVAPLQTRVADAGQTTEVNATRAAPPVGVRELPITLGHGRWAVPGRLTIPASASIGHPVPAVVLVPGSGPATMDLPVGGTLIFRDLAWGLAARGVASVRFTKRTVEHANLFTAAKHRPTLDEEFLDEAASAVRLLRRTPAIDPRLIYAFGHSQGATLAATVANRNHLAGAVAMAGSPRRTGDIIAQQGSFGLSVAKDGADRREAARVLEAGRAIAAITPDDDPAHIIMGAPVRYWRSLDAVKPLEQVRRLTARGGRVLLLAGGRDYLVEQADWQAWQVLHGRRGVTMRRFARLNHMMQEGDSQSTPLEDNVAVPVSAAFIEGVASWVTKAHRFDADGAMKPNARSSSSMKVPFSRQKSVQYTAKHLNRVICRMHFDPRPDVHQHLLAPESGRSFHIAPDDANKLSRPWPQPYAKYLLSAEQLG